MLHNNTKFATHNCCSQRSFFLTPSQTEITQTYWMTHSTFCWARLDGSWAVLVAPFKYKEVFLTLCVFFWNQKADSRKCHVYGDLCKDQETLKERHCVDKTLRQSMRERLPVCFFAIGSWQNKHGSSFGSVSTRDTNRKSETMCLQLLPERPAVQEQHQIMPSREEYPSGIRTLKRYHLLPVIFECTKAKAFLLLPWNQIENFRTS